MNAQGCHTGGAGVTLAGMPTTRPRLVLTENDELAEALDVAARRWPDETSRARLLQRLAQEGRRALAEQEEAALERRRDLIKSLSGSQTGVYGPGYLEELRADWLT